MRHLPCPSCGAKAAGGLARCPSCGGALDLRVEPLAEGEAPGADVELGRSTSRWWAGGAVVGAMALLVAGALAAGGRASRAIDVTTTTSSTSTSSTSTAVGRSTTTTRVPRTTTTVVPFSTTVLDRAPLLPLATPAASILYGLRRDHAELWRIDLATGAATVRRLDGPGGIARRIPVGDVVGALPRAGGVVLVSGSAPAFFVPDDSAEEPAEIGSGTFYYSVFAHADPARVWRVNQQTRSMRAEVVDLAGTAVGPGVDLPAGYPIGDDGAGGLLVAVAGNTYRVGDDGSTVRFSVGQPVAVNGEAVVTLECAETEVRCDLVGRSRADGSEIGRAPATTGFVNGGQPALLSPSGSVVAAYDYGDEALVFVSLDDGTTSEARFSPAGWGPGVLWWLDEQVLCGLETPGDVRCWTDRGQQSFVVRLADGVAFAAIAFTTPGS